MTNQKDVPRQELAVSASMDTDSEDAKKISGSDPKQSAVEIPPVVAEKEVVGENPSHSKSRRIL